MFAGARTDRGACLVIATYSWPCSARSPRAPSRPPLRHYAHMSSPTTEPPCTIGAGTTCAVTRAPGPIRAARTRDTRASARAGAHTVIAPTEAASTTTSSGATTPRMGIVMSSPSACACRPRAAAAARMPTSRPRPETSPAFAPPRCAWSTTNAPRPALYIKSRATHRAHRIRALAARQRRVRILAG